MNEDIRRARQILETCLQAIGDDPCDHSLSNLKSFMREILENTEDDYTISFWGCTSVRLIHDDIIDEVWTESLIQQIKDCYDLDHLPEFIEIDWEESAENCKDEGLGTHFNTYDGEEYFCNNWNIFRV